MLNQVSNQLTMDSRHINSQENFRHFRQTVEKLDDLAKKGLDTTDTRGGLHATRELVEIWKELDPAQRAAVGIELVQDYYRKSVNNGRHFQGGV